MNLTLKNQKQKQKTTLKAVLCFKIRANSATTGPPLGGLLGQYSISPALFCDQFNSRTSHINNNILLQVVIFLTISGEYKFNIKGPTTSFFLKKNLMLETGGSKPGFVSLKPKKIKSDSPKPIRFISRFMIYEILLYKKECSEFMFSSDRSFTSFVKKSKGSIISMGLHICI